MAYLFAPRPSDPNLPVFFNVDASVGRMGANTSRDDILLVQFLLKTLCNNMTTPKGLAVKPILLLTPQTGVIDEATIRSIEAFQGACGTPVDGRVSSARGHAYPGNLYTITHLNIKVRGDYRRAYPRLDQIPGCPSGIHDLMNRIL